MIPKTQVSSIKRSTTLVPVLWCWCCGAGGDAGGGGGLTMLKNWHEKRTQNGQLPGSHPCAMGIKGVQFPVQTMTTTARHKLPSTVELRHRQYIGRMNGRLHNERRRQPCGGLQPSSYEARLTAAVEGQTIFASANV